MIKAIEGCNLKINMDCFPVHIIQKIYSIRALLNNNKGHSHNIVGTGFNKDIVKAYGWQSPVLPHKDKTGFIFFMPIFIEKYDIISCNGEKLDLEVGQLYLLNDRISHETLGKGNVISLFCGSFQESEINDQFNKDIFNKMSSFLREPLI